MEKVTTYSARRSNVFVWLSVLLMLASAVTRIIWLTQTAESGFFLVVLGAVIPLLACLFIAVRLPLRGEKYFYLTVRPVMMLTLLFIYRIFMAFSGIEMTAPYVLTMISYLLICIGQGFLFYYTFSGRAASKWPVLLGYLVPMVIMCFDKMLRTAVFANLHGVWAGTVSDFAAALGILCVTLSAAKLPPWHPGEPYRFRYGDRMDGRLIRGGEPLDKVAPYIMTNRNGASNFIADSVEVSAMEKYIHKKRREGLKHFGITHVIIASYLRACAAYPGIMRFLSGQKAYQRMYVTMKMAVKKDLKLNSPETIISVDLLPSDGPEEIYRKFDEQLKASQKSSELDSSFDELAGILNLIPGVVLKFAIWLLKALDYLGLLPPELLALSPFHGSMFITSMGSLGIPPIYHHLYDFGNIPVFIAFGAKRTEYGVNAEGSVERRKYIDYKCVTDERIVDGHYYATAFKLIRSMLQHPEQLDVPPEEVKEDIY